MLLFLHVQSNVASRLRARTSRSRDFNEHSIATSLNDDIVNDSNLQKPNFSVELWLIDVISGQRIELAPSHKWIQSKLDKSRYHDVWQELARLRPQWRTAVLDFLHSRNQHEAPHLQWKPYFLDFPQVSRIGFLGHRQGGHLVQLIVYQQGDRSSEDLSTSSKVSSGGNISSISSSFQAPLDSSMKRRQDLSHDPGLKNSLKEASRSQEKAEDYGQNPRVSFAEDVIQDPLKSRVSEVVVETETVDGDPSWSRNTTFISKDLVATSALREFGYPFRDLSEEPLNTPQNRLRIPMMLTEKEVESLIRLTKAMMVDGKG